MDMGGPGCVGRRGRRSAEATCVQRVAFSGRLYAVWLGYLGDEGMAVMSVLRGRQHRLTSEVRLRKTIRRSHAPNVNRCRFASSTPGSCGTLMPVPGP